MNTDTTRPLTGALLAFLCLASACMPMPERNDGPPRPTWPEAKLDLNIVNGLGRAWSVEYVQVYVDGWLVWQGSPGTGYLGVHPAPGGGAQEVYVRAFAEKHGEEAGHLASAREVFSIGPGTQRIRIKLNQAFLKGDRFNVALAPR